jgi:hypothetical protein
MISIPLPATIPKRKAAERASVICALNIVIVLVKHWSCDLGLICRDQEMFSASISQTWSTLVVQDCLMRRRDSLMTNLQIRSTAIYCAPVVQGSVFVGQP